MKAKVGVILCVCVLVVGAWLTFAGLRSTSAAEKVPEPAAQVGRYQIFRSPDFTNSEATYLIDTATGKVYEWKIDGNNKVWKLYIASPKE